jgi:U3 small nucleolar RNA-associated protein 14
MGTPIYYVDLTVRGGVSVEDALAEAKRLEADRQEAGFDQVALETAARQGFSNGAFEENDEEGDSVVEEFFPEGDGGQGDPGLASERSSAPSLADKLEDQMARLGRDVG